MGTKRRCLGGGQSECDREGERKMWLEDKVGLWLNWKVFSKEQEASFESASGYIVEIGQDWAISGILATGSKDS